MATAERPTTKQRRIDGISGVKLGRVFVTQDEMKDMSPRWKQYSVSLSGESLTLSDEDILRRLLHTVTPLDIKGISEDGTPIALVAQLGRFPYSIDDKPHYQAVSLRLAPEQGRIESVTVSLSTANNLGLYHFDASSGGIVYEKYGFRLELLFEPIVEDLPLQAPSHYQESVYT